MMAARFETDYRTFRPLESSTINQPHLDFALPAKITLPRRANKPLIYMGPSLQKEEALQILDAEYRPPIRRGDLQAALREGYRFIGIIDGVFHQNLAVCIEEIRLTLAQGAQLYGAASMGAIRAAEAAVLGMRGVGQVYDWYRKGLIESDDEIALCFDSPSFKLLTEPLVNIRATLEAAMADGVVSAAVKGEFLKVAMQVHFSERTIIGICHRLKGALSQKTLDSITSYFLLHRVNVKNQDALELLGRIRRDMAAPALA